MILRYYGDGSFSTLLQFQLFQSHLHTLSVDFDVLFKTKRLLNCITFSVSVFQFFNITRQSRRSMNEARSKSLIAKGDARKESKDQGRPKDRSRRSADKDNDDKAKRRA